MSSLLQFRGQIDRNKGVGLEAYLVRKEFTLPSLPTYFEKVATELVTCSDCGRKHAQLYRFYRKPRGMFGCWVVFHWAGEDHVPDLSCPMDLEKLPRDAKRLSPEENAIAWHKE